MVRYLFKSPSTKDSAQIEMSQDTVIHKAYVMLINCPLFIVLGHEFKESSQMSKILLFERIGSSDFLIILTP